MDADLFRPDRYQHQVRSLIESVENCLQHACVDDRESRLQRDAFAERCERARAIAHRLLHSGDREQALLEGDAMRCLEALRLSRAFFRERVPEPA